MTRPGAPDAGSESRSGSVVTESRVVAAEILAAMRTGALLDASFDRIAGSLDQRDRRWVQELVYGLLRQRGWLDAVLTARITGGLARLDADLRDLLRLGAYQLLGMGSVPAYAAIAQTVELAKRRHGIGASKLANAVLRRIDRERDDASVATPTGTAAALGPAHDALDRLAVRTSHPRWLLERWRSRYHDEVDALLAYNNREAPIVVRPFGIDVDALQAALAERGVETTRAPWIDDGLVLPPGVSVTQLGPFQRGQLFVHDPGSALVVQYAHLAPGTRAADLCAAPGGKTLAMANRGVQVLAADRSGSRLERVRANLERVRATNVTVEAMDATAPTVQDMDAVLVDVPCSGTGTFRRHPDARWRLRLSNIAMLTATQRDIIAAASSCVRVGGLLIYSTCSLEPEENEGIVAQFLAEDDAFVLEPPPAGTVDPSLLDAGYLRVLPQRHDVDGAFAARLRRIR